MELSSAVTVTVSTSRATHGIDEVSNEGITVTNSKRIINNTITAMGIDQQVFSNKNLMIFLGKYI